ncbi:hypothetical protein C8A03DRAFT_13814 [Achaetomium macrosporum]|uniref:F-box domain-containing protein n=1 Tax=Achaetomium macrosporum TaxID=79813 RepID=A0AAN7HDM7_9PEZI|nr:hypothetical protein C8A03DRAFT_13814 [Achaetomium macrosporum]
MATPDTEPEAGDARRSSIEKKPVFVPDVDADADLDDGVPSAFERLPDEIIEQILQATDSNGFASLALLNTKWRSVAQQAHLYAHHLANCPSYATSHNAPAQATSDDDLPRLRRLFAKEIKRNLFEAYLRPNQTIIKVISNSISSSSCPGGEGIQFSPSPKGHHLLAYNSSRIHVIDLRAPEIEVKREFKILRRPAATCINDEGTTLAVLVTEMEVDIYDLTKTPPKRTQSMILDHSPRAIALSPCGSILAAAYEGGIEVSSLNPGALATERRAVKCDGVDALAFSFDGTQILGTTVQSSQPNTVILTAPYYDPGSHMADDNISTLWTTSILFPNTSRDCSHAVLIQNGKHEEAAWTFTYDRSFETFRAVRIDDLRNGTTYFTGPVPSPKSQARLLPCTLPAASYYGELVSAGFQGKEIWLYGIPEDLDAVPETANAGADGGSNGNGLFRRNSGPSMRSSARMQDNGESARVPQWQILCDKLRNTFITGYKIGELEGVNTVKFVADFADSCMKERLIVAARGVVPNISVTDDEGIDFVDGGRITILDFDYGIRDGTVKEYAIEVGTKEPEVLEEEHRDMDTEVAIVRRRTVAQKRGSRTAAVMRSMTGAARAPPLPTQPPARSEDDEDDPLVPRRIGVPPARSVPQRVATDEVETQSIEEQEALDAPYDHTSPRSGTTLRRAATAAANTRRLHLSAAAGGHIVYRRADGRTEHPHESDADNWVPPPPPYQKEDPCDLPSFLRHAAILPLAGTGTQSSGASAEQLRDRQANRNSSASMHQQHRRAQTVASANRHSSPVPPVPPLPSLSDIPPVPPVPPVPPIPAALQGAAGSSAPPVPVVPHGRSHGRAESSGVQSSNGDASRPATRDSRYLEGENIYDVSPPDSPAMAPVADRVSPTLDPQVTIQANGSLSPPANEASATGGEPLIRRISVSRTWPIQPMPINTANASAGSPYSAPPVNGSQALSQSFIHPPRPEQMPNISNHASGSRPFSGSFQLPPRIPADNHMSGDWRRTSYQRPVSQQQHYSFPLQRPQSPILQINARATIHAPQPQRSHGVSRAAPEEDMPLIISTPKGVSGAFDPPDRHPSERRAETPILAPVPHRPRPQTQASILRRAQERLDAIYSSSTAPGQQGAVQLTVPPIPPAPASTSTGFSRRIPSLSRRQSRAERSAAKNVADAKRRGWTGRSKSRRKKKKERDFDAASTAAWTDVTVGPNSVRSGFMGHGAGGNGNNGEQAVVDGVKESLGSGVSAKGQRDHDDDAAVVFVSKSLASWLDDDTFLTRMVASAGITSGNTPRELTVLAAAVDEVPCYDLGLDVFSSSEGVSILRGNASRVLQDLTRLPDVESPEEGAQEPSLEFHPPPCRYAGPLAVTVPLANTVFSNGRPHTLFASRWGSELSGFPRLVKNTQMTSQRIVLPAAGMGISEDQPTSSVASHLVPVTSPRRIEAGLGNILRNIEISGSPQPASQELEDVIPRLLEARRKAQSGDKGQDSPSGPIDVWALVIPAHYFEKSLPISNPVELGKYQCSDEVGLARAVANQVDMFLAGGCQLRKVLSGGGGWGLKKGLLSLDPQTRLTTDEHQNLESFINSFKGETSAGGIVTPGSYVQFFVEPALPPQDDARVTPSAPRTLTIVFGTHARPIRPPLAGSDSVKAWPSLFGALSSEAMYISHRGGARDGHAIATKIDVPRSYMVSSVSSTVP